MLHCMQNHLSLSCFLFIVFLLGCQNAKKASSDSVLTVKDSLITIPDTITLLFAGDIMQHSAQLEAAKTANGYDYNSYFKHIRKELLAADLTIGNLETPVGDPRYSGYPMFNAPRELAAECKASGFDILLTANNHSVDRYGKGIEQTILTLDSLEIDHLGTYCNSLERDSLHPYIKDIRGAKIAFLNYTYGTNGINIPDPYIVNLIDTTQIKLDLAKARHKGSDVNLVCIHWGIEYVTKPAKEQVKLAKWLLANGADHVIGGHPHVIQPIQSFTDSLTGQKRTVVYSLGNFISNMSVKKTDGGMLFRMKLYKDKGQWESKSSYTLVWTGRPVITGEKNFTLYPVFSKNSELRKSAVNKLNIFKKEAEKVMQHNTSDIEKWDL